MIVTCARTRSSLLADHQRGRFAGLDQEFSLTVGTSYIVVGMGVWETVLHVLIRDDWGLPSWCPLGLFDCPPQPLPSGWEFSLGDGIAASGTDLWTRWVARWGYRELVRDPAHSDALMERDPEAMDIFAKEITRREGDLP